MALFKRSILSFFSLVFIYSLVSCKKEVEAKPIADFTFDKEEYFEGDTIRLTNTSKNASTYKWTLPSGIQSEDKDVSFHIERLNLERELHFKLVAYSESGYKSEYIVKNKQAKIGTGQFVLSDAGTCGCEYYIYIDNVGIGSVSLPDYFEESYKQFPNCGEGVYPTYTISAGNHTIQAIKAGWTSWTKAFEVKRDDCTLIRLGYD